MAFKTGKQTVSRPVIETGIPVIIHIIFGFPFIAGIVSLIPVLHLISVFVGIVIIHIFVSARNFKEIPIELFRPESQVEISST